MLNGLDPFCRSFSLAEEPSIPGFEPRLLYRSESPDHRFSFFPRREWTESDIATSADFGQAAPEIKQEVETSVAEVVDPDMTSSSAEVRFRSEAIAIPNEVLRSEQTGGATHDLDMTSSEEVGGGHEAWRSHEAHFSPGPVALANAASAFASLQQLPTSRFIVFPQQGVRELRLRQPKSKNLYFAPSIKSPPSPRLV